MSNVIGTSNNTVPPSKNILVGKVSAKQVGAGDGVLYAAVNGTGTSQSVKNHSGNFSSSDPQLKKLVNNMYRGLLKTKHERACDIVDSLPKDRVTSDAGIDDRLASMMKQQADLSKARMINLGPSPAPPPPPFSVSSKSVESNKPAVSSPKPSVPVASPPAALASAMMKERKPFTYTPGGINLDEIKDVPEASCNNDRHLQTSGFQHSIETPYCAQPNQVLSTSNKANGNRMYGGSAIPSRSFRILQAMTEDSSTGQLSQESSNKSINGQFLQIQKENSLKNQAGISSLTNGHSSSPHSNIMAPSFANSGRNTVSSSNAYPSKTQESLNNYNAPNETRKYNPHPYQVIDHQKNDAQRAAIDMKHQNPSIKPQNDVEERSKLYGGSNIPSRIFSQLQKDFSQEEQKTKHHVSEINIPMNFNNFNIDDNKNTGSNASDCNSDKVFEVASTKQSVLKELTSQFDPKTNLKKPSAAPGRSFKYLQQQYGEPSQTGVYSPDHSNGYEYRDVPESFASRISSGFHNGQQEYESKPFNGRIIPGRTFKLLQENIETHPSVLQARK